MDKLTEKKILEAKEHVQAAEKGLKTSLFKRTPDFDTAASEYNQAAMCCKIAKQLDKAIEYFQKSSDCYISLKSQFNAAKQLEQVAFVANELKKHDVTYQSIAKAADLFIENGTRDTAGILLEKGANMLKQLDPERSLLLYKKAIWVAEVEDKYHDINSFYQHCIPLAMRLNKLTEAIELMRSCIDNLCKIKSYDSISKYLASIVIIYLSNDDWVSAMKEIKQMKENYNYESDRIQSIVDAFDEKDEEAYQTLLKNYLSYTLDSELLKLAQKITKVGDWSKVPPKAQVAVAAAAPPPPHHYTPMPVEQQFEEKVKITEDQHPAETVAAPAPVKQPPPEEEEGEEESDEEPEL